MITTFLVNLMASVCFYFQLHQPLRIKHLERFKENDNDYFSDISDNALNNFEILKKVTHNCYIPASKTILDLLKNFPEFKVSYSISGILLEQLEHYFPEVIVLFKKLNETGRVEFINETYYHSLSYLCSKKEFIKQVRQHQSIIKELFEVRPLTFRNTELIFSDEIASIAKKLGFKTILAEGANQLIGWNSPNHVYKADSKDGINLLLRNYSLSDDIAFRFSNYQWFEFPMRADKFARKIDKIEQTGGEIVNIFIDYETFGEHQWEVTGIFEFLKWLPIEILKNPENNFITTSEASKRYKPKEILSSKEPISWADKERDISAWASNQIQKNALHKVYSLEERALATRNASIISDWRKLQISDHFYYMCTKDYSEKSGGDIDVHAYFTPYRNPDEAYHCFMKACECLEQRIENLEDLNKSISG